MSSIIFLIGGARSGKSSYAVDLARECHGGVAYLATGVACDEEMEERIEKHKNDRPDSWETMEEPLNLEDALKNMNSSIKLVLLDCLGFWVSNLIFHYQSQGKTDSQVEEAVLKRVLEFVSLAKEIDPKIIIVSNEVGMGIVPEAPLGRLFRDVLGRANQIMASRADEVRFFVAGLSMKMK